MTQPTPRKTHPVRHRAGPVITRHVLEGLVPALRATALRMAAGDPSRVRILSRSRFEVDDPGRDVRQRLEG